MNLLQIINIALISFILLSACATNHAVSLNSPLKENEAIVVANLECPNILYYDIFKAGQHEKYMNNYNKNGFFHKPYAYYNAAKVNCDGGQGYNSFKLEEGQYYISNILTDYDMKLDVSPSAAIIGIPGLVAPKGEGGFYFPDESSTITFKVIAGKINYIGDIRFTPENIIGPNDSPHLSNVIIKNNKPGLKTFLKNSNIDQSNLEVVTNLAKN